MGFLHVTFVQKWKWTNRCLSRAPGHRDDPCPMNSSAILFGIKLSSSSIIFLRKQTHISPFSKNSFFETSFWGFHSRKYANIRVIHLRELKKNRKMQQVHLESPPDTAIVNFMSLGCPSGLVQADHLTFNHSFRQSTVGFQESSLIAFLPTAEQ